MNKDQLAQLKRHVKRIAPKVPVVEAVCERCHGDKVLFCSRCCGVGMPPDSAFNCPLCGGKGAVPCEVCQ